MFLSAGAPASVLLDERDQLWAAGRNRGGELIKGGPQTLTEMTLIPWAGPQIVQVTSGKQFTLILDITGTLWASNRFQPQPAPPNTTFSPLPDLPPIQKVAASGESFAAIGKDGTLWIRPSGAQLQKAPGEEYESVTCSSERVLAANAAGLWLFSLLPGRLEIGPVSAGIPSRLPRAISSGRSFFVIVDCDGGVWTMGSPQYGQLGRGAVHDGMDQEWGRVPGVPPMRTVVAGGFTVIGLDEEQQCWAWGCNTQGILGLEGREADIVVPTRHPRLDGALQIASGRSHSMALLQDGTLLTFGYQCYGEMGQRDPQSGRVLHDIIPAPLSSRAKSARSSLANQEPYKSIID